tara:strand:- start:424 stop:1005 length:582 start_codon:yes stop_codon:yes gene_type:complete
MKYILFISLLFTSCSKNSESNSINEDESLASETEQISSKNYEIYLLEQLNENRGYCIDIKGSKLNADPDNGLQAHTCYSYQGEVSVDQGFDNVKIDEDEFYMPFFEVCMEAENTSVSSILKLKVCNKNVKQKFKFNSNEEIVLSDNTNLCLTVSENSREGGGGTPTHLIRDLILDNCSADISTRQRWGLRKAQ